MIPLVASVPGVSHDGAPGAALPPALHPGLLLPLLAPQAAPSPEETLRVQEQLPQERPSAQATPQVQYTGVMQ